ncbi:hypothetical protein A2U01_0034860 [Trifolium medium]|uniref:Uncharacterized protein n=1 Tax=Trifolium medium TaxID=97028 RepID=A0A392PQL7_9FABA|nr:hypothetical protein [Trifolium medium]
MPSREKFLPPKSKLSQGYPRSAPRQAKGFKRQEFKAQLKPLDRALRILQERVLISSNSFSQSRPA